MRAACERCSGLQPADWAPGDLCVHCGVAARHDVRCAWCATWTPRDRYCRECGAEVVDQTHFGAARMLKDAGVDRFSVANRLAAMDLAQVENFTRIYQRHAAAVARHVDELHHLEQFLHHRGFAAALEDRLLPELPWNDDVLRRYSVGSPRLTDDIVATARHIAETTPFDTTRELAQLVRLRADDFEAAQPACAAFDSCDPLVRAEAALVLTSWRVRLGAGSLADRVSGGRAALIEELRRTSLLAHAAVRLAVLEPAHPAPPLVPADAIDSPERELSMAAVLLSGDPDRLEAALDGDRLERLAAADALAAAGVVRRLGPVLLGLGDDERAVVLQTLVSAKRPIPALTETLVRIIETTQHARVRELATRAACPTLDTTDVLRIVSSASGDRRIAQALLQQTVLPAEGLAALVDALIERDEFSSSMFGVSSLATDGRLPDPFVPTRWPAANNRVRHELLALAELQLTARGDEDLHRFVLGVVFGEQSGTIRATAWWVLHRWYRSRGEYRGHGPLRLSPDVIDRFFGSVDAFVPRFVEVVRDDEALRTVGFFELIADLCKEADDAFVVAVQAMHRSGHDLVVALGAAIGGDYWPSTVEAMTTLLSRIGTVDAWRDEALTSLRAVDRSGNHHHDLAVRRLELSRYGMPEPMRWNELPLHIVPERFESVDAAGQLELLAVVDHQLIHHERSEATSQLVDWLAGIADASVGEVGEVRERAAEIHRERAWGHARPTPPAVVTRTAEFERGAEW